jgi:hypothetical protein
MLAFVRSIVAILVGLFVAVITLSLFEYVSAMVFPLPPGIDPTDAEALRSVVGQIPFPAYLIILLGWSVAAFVGAWLAGRMAGRASLLHGLIEAVLLLTAGVTNLFMIPHPIWVTILGLAAFVGLGYAGARSAVKVKPAL